MSAAPQLKIERPDEDWVRLNFLMLHDNCWALRPPLEGQTLIALVPIFDNMVVDLGKVTWVERIRESLTFWVITDKLPVVKDRYEPGLKVHLVREAIL